uniref:MIT_C domain-containing protein n=1 Tax=Rhabditophanes sp. KR3021 TaxID=114890 RepID=A0AC35TQX8_9BILA
MDSLSKADLKEGLNEFANLYHIITDAEEKKIVLENIIGLCLYIDDDECKTIYNKFCEIRTSGNCSPNILRAHSRSSSENECGPEDLYKTDLETIKEKVDFMIITQKHHTKKDVEKYWKDIEKEIETLMERTSNNPDNQQEFFLLFEKIQLNRENENKKFDINAQSAWTNAVKKESSFAVAAIRSAPQTPIIKVVKQKNLSISSDTPLIGHRIIAPDSIHHSFHSIFSKYIDTDKHKANDVTEITIEDRYILKGYQFNNLKMFIDYAKTICVNLNTVTLLSGYNYEGAGTTKEVVEEQLRKLEKFCKKKHIHFIKNAKIAPHDRYIKFNNGLAAQFSRGLDIYKYNDPSKDSDQWICRDSTVNFYSIFEL